MTNRFLTYKEFVDALESICKENANKEFWKGNNCHDCKLERYRVDGYGGLECVASLMFKLKDDFFKIVCDHIENKEANT